jgi:two-component system nitrogen regulation sensor histidine kinase GlnL
VFSILATENQTRIPVTVAIVLATLLVAFALSAMAVFQVLEEYRLLGDWLVRPGTVPISEIQALRQDIWTRIIVRSTASAVLLLCTLLTFWLQQRQLIIRRTLHQVKLLAHNILASLNQGVITTDHRGTITSINSAAIELIGFDVECIGRPIASISSAEVPLESLCRSVTERKGAVRDLDLTMDREGRIRRLVASALELKDIRGAAIGCVIHLRDVTERMLMKEQMWRMEQFASLSTLATGLVHEIRNPITALSIHVQLLEERLRSDSADRTTVELIGILKAEVHRLNHTLTSFRDFASLERLNLKSTDAQDVLEDVARLIAPQANLQGVKMELRRSQETLPRVELDPEKIQQAVLNLVLNALEAMPGGGHLTLGTEVDDGILRLVVRDSGQGIPQEIQDHIFRPYFSTKGSGTGMGLALAEKLVRQHRGHLDFRTNPAGTTFTIALPVNARNGSAGGP